MKTEQLQESIGRFRASFWDRIETDRPPVGIVDPNVWLPIQYLRHAPDQTEIKPEFVIPALVKNDYEHVFANRTYMGDDLIPFAAPWRGIPWLEAMCGCSVQYASGSLAPKAWIPTCAQLQDMPIPADTHWLTCMRCQLDELRADLPEDCWQRKEARDQLILAITDLPTSEQELIVGYYFQDESHARLAARQGISERAVAGRLYRARQALRRKLRDLDV